MVLSGRVPPHLTCVPPDVWAGVAERGQALLHGQYPFGGQVLKGEFPDWLDDAAGPAWLAAMHGFDWLRDLRAVGGDAARRQARVLVNHWVEMQGHWHPVSWAPDLLGQRVASWIGQHDFFLASADDLLRAKVFDSLARQMRHLHRMLPGRLKGSALLLALKGLAYGGLCLPGFEKSAARATALLVRELPRQILADGGHVERSPLVQLEVLRHLVDLRGAYRTARVEVPTALQHAIDRMAPTVRFFRHGDGGLALFNGAVEQGADAVDVVLAQADARGRPLKSLTHTGFERLAAGPTVVLLDAGAPPGPGLDRAAHAGTLSFEMSVGVERLIVNCGAHPAEVGPWRAALAATAAHSTAVLADTNSAGVVEAGGLSRRPGRVEHKRQDAAAGILVEASHDGYRETSGLVHHRRLYLATSGEDLRGEDRLDGAGGVPFTLRFHLHPAVQVYAGDTPDSLWLRLEAGGDWRFRAVGGSVELTESVYLGHGGPDPVPTWQITVKGTTDRGGTLVKWVLQREVLAGEADTP